MSLQRKLAQSDVKRMIALDTGKTKKDNTAPADVVLTPNTVTRLDTTQPLFKQKMQERGNTLQAQSDATAVKDAAMEKSKMFISHFIQCFNNGVKRGVFPVSHKAFYQLDVNSDSVPTMNTEAEVNLWGNHLIDGDAERITAGGSAMSMPAIAEVTTEVNLFQTLNADQSTAKDAYDNAQEAVSDMRPEVDSLILRIWDEVETAFNDEPIESKRRKAREWGVVYISTQKATITGLVTDSASGNPLLNVNVALIESEEVVQTDEEGRYTLKTSYTGEGTLEFALDGYTTQTFPVTIEEGGELTQDVNLVAV
ncbi:carboxypeptidase regulatory-like domain-containing protein [Bacteroidota bacterium]